MIDFELIYIPPFLVLTLPSLSSLTLFSRQFTRRTTLNSKPQKRQQEPPPTDLFKENIICMFTDVKEDEVAEIHNCLGPE